MRLSRCSARPSTLAVAMTLVALLAACSSDGDAPDSDADDLRPTPIATQIAAATAEADAQLTPATPTPVPFASPTPTARTSAPATPAPSTQVPFAPTPVPSTPTPVPPSPTPTATLLPTLDTSQLATPTPSPTPTPPPITTVLNSGPLGQTKIVFTRATPGVQGAEIRTIGPDGSRDTVLRSFDRSVHNPKWSPDGTLVVAFESNASNLVTYVALDEEGTVVSTQRQWACVSCELHAVWPTETKGTVFITRDGGLIEHDVSTGSVVGGLVENFVDLPRPGEFWGIDLLTDTASFLLSSDMDGNWELYTGFGSTRLTNTEGNETQPRYSPAGTHIVFTTDRPGNRDVFVMNLETRTLRQITTSTAADVDPVWSPDGKFIAFASNRQGSYDLYIASALGGEAEFLFRVTSSIEDDRSPDWQAFR